MLVADSSKRLQESKGISYSATDAALEYLIDNGGYDQALGARPMRTTIQRLIETAVAEMIIRDHVERGMDLVVDCPNGNAIVVSKSAESEAASRQLQFSVLEQAPVATR